MILKLRIFRLKNFINFLIFSPCFHAISLCRGRFFPSAGRTNRFCHQKCTHGIAHILPDSLHRIFHSPAYPERSSVHFRSNLLPWGICTPYSQCFYLGSYHHPSIIGAAFHFWSYSSLKIIHGYVFWRDKRDTVTIVYIS